MNKDLSHLPQNKRVDLQRVVEIVRKHCPAVGMIVLFGSYARGDWKEIKDLAPDRKSGHPSDYDILAIFEEGGECSSLAWQDIEKACAEEKLSATPRFIHHDIRFVNRKVEIGQYFFSDILGEGKLLFDAGLFELAERRELTYKERLQIAQEDFDEWFGISLQFFDTYKYHYSKDWLKLSAFDLHQAAETAYKALLIIFTGYIPDEHYLSILGGQAAKLNPAFEKVFKSNNEFERDAFTALEYAYIGARYDKRYTINEPTVLYLASRVEELLKITETNCLEKIEIIKRLSVSA